MENKSILFLNFLLYLFVLFFYYKKKNKFDLGFVCLFMFMLSSLGSVIYYSFDMVPLYYPNIRVLPLLYLFSLAMLCFYPLLSINSTNIKYFDNEGYDNIFKIIAIIFSVCSIPVFCNLLINMGTLSFAENVLNSMYESNEDNANAVFSPWARPFFSVIRRFYDLIALLLCYFLIKKNNKQFKFILSGLSLSMLSFFLYAFQSGSRGGLVMYIIVAIGYFIILYGMFSDKVKKNIKIASLTIVSVLALGLSAISISRFTSGTTSTSDILISQWISQYLGEGMIRFTDVLWPIDEQLNGDKNFSYLKSIVGFDRIEDNERANLAYEGRIGVSTSVFYTFIGSFYLDFNVIGTIVVSLFIFLFLRLICNKIKLKKKIGFIETIILVKFFKLFATGFTSNVFAVTSIQQDEFIFWMLILLIYLIHLTGYKFTPPEWLTSIKYQFCTIMSHRTLKRCAI